MTHAAQLQRLIAFYEGIRPDTVGAELAAIYAADARFKDPFNDVTGHAAIAAIFTHMFSQVQAPRFLVTTRVLEGDDAFLTWDFVFTMKHRAGEQCIRGATHLRFNGDGAVVLHRDYWDVAEELYEKLPLLGSIMRFIKRLANR